MGKKYKTTSKSFRVACKTVMWQCGTPSSSPVSALYISNAPTQRISHHSQTHKYFYVSVSSLNYPSKSNSNVTFFGTIFTIPYYSLLVSTK